MKRIYLTVYDNIPEEKALRFAAKLIEVLPERQGVVKWEDGTCAAFNERAKNTSITLWMDKPYN